MQVGDLVDISRPTLSKDVPRWHGPASITDVTAVPDGIIGVRWQGRNLQVRVQDARRALAFAYAPAFFGGANSPIEVLKVAAESFKGCMRLDGSVRTINGCHVKATKNTLKFCMQDFMLEPSTCNS